MDTNKLNNFIKNALNRTLTKATKIQKDLIREEYNLNAKLLNKLTKTKKASPFNLKAQIKTKSAKLSINQFKKTKVKNGVKVSINKKEKPLIKQAFLIKPRSGGSVLVTRLNQVQYGFIPSPARIYSYKELKSPRLHNDLYYLNTPLLSDIALKHTKDLQIQVIEIFNKEISK